MRPLSFKVARDLLRQMQHTLTRVDVDSWRVNFEGAHESAGEICDSLESAVYRAEMRSRDRFITLANRVRSTANTWES